MNWIFLALSNVFIAGVVSILDSHLISKRLPSYRTFCLLSAIMHIFYGTLFFILEPIPAGTPILPLLAALGSGVCRAFSLTIVVHSLHRVAVSQAIPISNTYPVFVALMAVPLLGETLNPLQWLAIIIVIIGAVMVSIEKTPPGQAKQPINHVLLIAISSPVFAVASILNKYALAYTTYWNNFSILAICIAASFLYMSVRPGTFRELREMKNKAGTLIFIFLEQSLVPLASLLMLRAIQLGPVSLVSAVLGTRPVFIAVVSFLLSFTSPGFLIKSDVKQVMLTRLAAAALITGGIVIIYMA